MSRDLTVVTVLKSGGCFEPRHVQSLQRQVAEHLPGAPFVVLSDQHVPGVNRRALKKNSWTGWFAKMELFDPEIKGDLLFMDLDTALVGSLVDVASVGKLTLLRDFYRDGVYKGRAEGLGSGLMYLPEADRGEVWAAWMTNPFKHISELRLQGKGDQAFLEPLWLNKASRWQDVVPGQVVSYKVHVNPNWKVAGSVPAVPEGARVICYHGRPRPWDVGGKLKVA